jgi:hypothetical protein
LAGTGNTGSVSNVNTLVGGVGADIVTFATKLTNGSVDLVAGSDSLTLAAGGNTVSVANTETLIGGGGADTVTLSGALTTAMSVDLGAGSNKLSLDDLTNTGSVSNVQSLIGGSGQDTVTLGTAMATGSVDLGAGNDVLRFANATNSASVTNTETVFGGTGADTIVLTGSNACLVDAGAGLNFITGNSGADQFVFDQASANNTSTIQNFNAANGDVIALDTTTSAILPGTNYDLGGAALTAADLTSTTDASTLVGVSLSNGGHGGFAYQQDTGELYYSNNGNFAGGGTLVGVVYTSGTTPWVFDATKFTQV